MLSAQDCSAALRKLFYFPLLCFRSLRMFAQSGLRPWFVYLCQHSAGRRKHPSWTHWLSWLTYCLGRSPPSAGCKGWLIVISDRGRNNMAKSRPLWLYAKSSGPQVEHLDWTPQPLLLGWSETLPISQSPHMTTEQLTWLIFLCLDQSKSPQPGFHISRIRSMDYSTTMIHGHKDVHNVLLIFLLPFICLFVGQYF